MKKSLVLTAIAATLAAPAFAQSSVTIYGRLNESVEATKAGSVKNKQVVDNASRIGFKGTEDLGGGLQAQFLIEHGFDASTGKADSTFWGRESWVGLNSSKLGQIKVGNMAASEAYFATADYISMHNHDTGTSSDALWGYVVTGALKNAVAYATPDLGGFVGHVEVAEAAAGTTKRPISAAGNFDKGPLHLGLGYEKLGDDKSTSVRGLYELGAITLGAYAGKTSGSVDRKFFRVSGKYAVGASEFDVNFGKTGDVKGVSDSGASQWTVAYGYNLSKRTKVYTFYTKINNDTNAAYNASSAIKGAKGADLSSLAVGVRHNF